MTHLWKKVEELGVDTDDIRIPAEVYNDLIEQAEEHGEDEEDWKPSSPLVLRLASGLKPEEYPLMDQSGLQGLIIHQMMHNSYVIRMFFN